MPDELAAIAAHLDIAGTWQRSHPAADVPPNTIRTGETSPPVGLVAALRGHGLDRWPGEALEPLVRLADGWAGSVEDLVHVAGTLDLHPTG